MAVYYTYRILLFLLLAGVINGCTFGVHKGLISCSRCHLGEPSAGMPMSKYPENPSDVCRECHRYRTAGDHHPLSTKPGPFGNTASVGSEFKLVDGKMECLTCHNVHVEGYKWDSWNFLVGGPYSDRRVPCFKCHGKAAYEGVNPHESMLDEEGGLKRATCLFCHEVVPDPEVDTFRTIKLRASPAFLCWRCHEPMPGKFFKTHFLAKPDKQLVMEMRKSGLLFPLDPAGRVTCSTCHNPHQKGIMKNTEAKKGAGTKFMLRYKSICKNCHTSKRNM